MRDIGARDLAWLTAGAFVLAAGTNGFVVPNSLSHGGIAGLCVVAHHFTGIPVALLYFAVNVPILIFGWCTLGRRFCGKTVAGVAVFAAALYITRGLEFRMDDLLLATLYGGAVTGLGAGLMFRAGGSSGGMDIIAVYLKRRHGLSLAATYTVADIVILAIVGLTMGADKALYALIITFVGGKVADYVQEGISRAKAAVIISDRAQEIASVIMEDLSRGVTYLSGWGAYTSAEKQVILVALNIREVARLKRIIERIDPRAFVIVTDVAEVLGEGFEGGLA
ncbi:MAG: YitT family protein [Firmicutes bacterium]|nr:YitT family protein [Bacillota bacterium]